MRAPKRRHPWLWAFMACPALILAGLLLTIVHTPWWLLLVPAAMGAALVFAAAQQMVVHREREDERDWLDGGAS